MYVTQGDTKGVSFINTSDKVLMSETESPGNSMETLLCQPH